MTERQELAFSERANERDGSVEPTPRRGPAPVRRPEAEERGRAADEAYEDASGSYGRAGEPDRGHENDSYTDPAEASAPSQSALVAMVTSRWVARVSAT